MVNIQKRREEGKAGGVGGREGGRKEGRRKNKQNDDVVEIFNTFTT